MSIELREALGELAREARPAGDPSAAVAVARGRQRREWLLAVPAVAVVALLVVALFAVVQGGRVVQPADGPGSLPDRIYPAPSRMLTLQQSPIGRIGMLYAQPVVNGISSWIAVGAEQDTYRWVAPFQSPQDAVDVSSDGGLVAVGVSDQQAQSCSVQVIDAATGSVQEIVPDDVPLGCIVDGFGLSPDGGHLVVLVVKVSQRQGGGDWSGRQTWWSVDLAAGQQRKVDVSGAERLVGWSDGSDPVFEVDDTSFRRSKRLGLNPSALVVVRDGGAGLSEPFGRLHRLTGADSSSALSPDGTLIAAVVDPSPASSHTVEPRTLQVWDVRRGELVRSVPLGRNVDGSVGVVGWREGSTPVLSQVPVAKGGDPASGPDGGLFAYPPDAQPQRLVSAPRSTTFFGAVVAQDPLLVPVREASAPHQPWYDPRLLGPRLWDALRGPLALLLVVVVAVVAWVLVLRHYTRRLP